MASNFGSQFSQQNGRLSCDDYTVGWICALPIELAAARAMLTETHCEPADRPDDRNMYKYGSIGPHNVVIACLPSGTYGTTSAAVVATEMRASFRSIKLCFMVGIGGGVPRPSQGVDIRLGDVIVGTRVVQYDYGKTIAGGHFQATGSLNKPPTEILNAISALQADHLLGEGQLPSIISEITKKYATVFGSPGQQNDILFEADYDHPDDTNRLCDKCDESKIIPRSARNDDHPIIHYGVIASGNQVMKHGKTRDRIAQEFDIQCFEMEAAGLMDNFQCLTVRGICDYSDSHKNKIWQGYAAITAAAYTKELLQSMHSAANDKISNRDRELERLKIRSLKTLSFGNLESRQNDIEDAHPSTCDWLFDTSEFIQWRSRKAFREYNGVLWIKGKPGAGKSTLVKHIYRHTKDFFPTHVVASYFFNARGFELEKSFFGMLRSLLYQLIDQEPEFSKEFLALFLAKEKRYQSYHWEWRLNELKDFLLTLIRQKTRCILLLIDALDECNENESRQVVGFLEELSQNASTADTSLNICLSSRHYPTISMKKMLELVVESRAEHEWDIALYVKDKLRGDDRNIEDEIVKKAEGVFMWVILVVEMLNRAFDEGMITNLYRKLNEIPSDLDEVFHLLLSQDNTYKDKTIIMLQWVLFAKHPLGPEELYHAVLAGTEPKSVGYRNKELPTLSTIRKFITTCSRGLIEVRAWVDSRPSSYSLGREVTWFNTAPVPSLVHSTHFIHETVKDFLLRNRRLQKLDPVLSTNVIGRSHAKLASCCWAYIKVQEHTHLDLLGRTIDARCDPSSLSLGKMFPFLHYVVFEIFHHVEQAHNAKADQLEFLKDLQSEPIYLRLIEYLQMAGLGLLGSQGDPIISRRTRRWNSDQVFISDLVPSIELYKNSKEDLKLSPGPVEVLNILCFDNRPALAREWIKAVAVDVNIRAGYYDYAIIAATTSLSMRSNKSFDVLDVLLEAGANPNSYSQNCRETVLHAISNCCYDSDLKEASAAVVERLLVAGADPNAKSKHGFNPLQMILDASQELDEITLLTIQSFLRAGLDVNYQAGDLNESLLIIAVKTPAAFSDIRVKVETIRMLLDAGADVNAQGGKYGNALQTAIENSFETPISLEIIKILINAGADVNAQGGMHGNALQAAIANALTRSRIPNSLEVVEILIDVGADANQTCGPDGNALLTVLKSSEDYLSDKTQITQIIRILIAANADVNVYDSDGTSALEIAIANVVYSYLSHQVVWMLLEAGANIDVKMAGWDGDWEIIVEPLFAEASKQPSGKMCLYDISPHNMLKILRVLLKTGGGCAVQAKRFLSQVEHWSVEDIAALQDCEPESDEFSNLLEIERE